MRHISENCWSRSLCIFSLRRAIQFLTKLDQVLLKQFCLSSVCLNYRMDFIKAAVKILKSGQVQLIIIVLKCSLFHLAQSDSTIIICQGQRSSSEALTPGLRYAVVTTSWLQLLSCANPITHTFIITITSLLDLSFIAPFLTANKRDLPSHAVRWGIYQLNAAIQLNCFSLKRLGTFPGISLDTLKLLTYC